MKEIHYENCMCWYQSCDVPVNVFLFKIHVSLWVNFNQKISEWILTRILSYKLIVNYIMQNSMLTEKIDLSHHWYQRHYW